MVCQSTYKQGILYPVLLKSLKNEEECQKLIDELNLKRIDKEALQFGSNNVRYAKVTELRELGYTQNAIAAELQLSQSYVCRVLLSYSLVNFSEALANFCSKSNAELIKQLHESPQEHWRDKVRDLANQYKLPNHIVLKALTLRNIDGKFLYYSAKTVPKETFEKYLQQGLTQKQIGKLLNLSQSHVSRYLKKYGLKSIGM